VTGQTNPTYTDGQLRVNTHAAYPGRICIFFVAGTRIDPKSVFVAGDPRLGLDLAAVQILRFIPGTGNVPIRPAAGGVEVLDDRIVFSPTLPLPEGQYSIGVFAQVRGLDGRALAPTPVFHSFTVGSADTIAPQIVITSPIAGSRDVGAGLLLTRDGRGPIVSGVQALASPDIVIRFTEQIAAASVTPETLRVVDVGAFVPNGLESPQVKPAPGYPMLRSGERGTDGFEIVWRPDPSSGGLPIGTRIRVTVVGSDEGKNAQALADVAGNALPTSFDFEFTTRPPPNLPAGR
jgi:hypothetical protein